MSYRLPSRRLKKNNEQSLNLIPILDAVFILVFFLLMSAQFIKIYEISSDVPIISNDPPPKNKKKPLALTVNITKKGFTLLTGVPARTYKVIGKTPEDTYDFLGLHDTLVKLKKENPDENDVVLEPKIDLTYEEIVKIMDSVRKLKSTDDTIYKKLKDGTDIAVKELFNKIVFGNLMS